MGLAGALRALVVGRRGARVRRAGAALDLRQPLPDPQHPPAARPATLAEARALERVEGVPRDASSKSQDVHRFTTAPNAEAVGFGPTRSVILWDTLLDGALQPRAKSAP